jgi:hypothetical protein
MCIPQSVSTASGWVRPLHRWLSLSFTLAVVANLIAMARDYRAVWVGLLALIPLALLLFTGLYLFVRPYINHWRARRDGPLSNDRIAHPAASSLDTVPVGVRHSRPAL